MSHGVPILVGIDCCRSIPIDRPLQPFSHRKQWGPVQFRVSLAGIQLEVLGLMRTRHGRFFNDLASLPMADHGIGKHTDGHGIRFRWTEIPT